MRYEHEAEDGGGRLRGAASRFDRWGTRRGSPYAADPAYDEPPLEPVPGALPWTGGAGGGAGWSAGRPERPGGPRGGGFGGGDVAASWIGGGSGGGAGGGGWDDGAADGGFDGGWGGGYAVDAEPIDGGAIYDGPIYGIYGGGLYGGPWLPPRVWYRWRRRPWFPRFHGMLRRARPAGVLRHRRTGARYPVYRGRMGGRGWRIVTRPVGSGFRGGREGGVRREVIAMEAETGVEGEAFPIGGGAPSAAAPPSPPINGPWRLRLPHASLHGILGRMPPEQLRRMGGGRIPVDPAATVVRRVGRAARRARRLGRFRTRHGVSMLDVFAAPGMRLLVRPLGEMEGEIVAVAPVEGEEEVIPNRAQGYRRTVPGVGTFRVRGAHVTIDWSSPVPLAGVRSVRAPAGSVYVLLANNRPIYVGQSVAWGSRWAQRLQVLSEFGIPTAPYTVSVGTITWDPAQPPPPSQALMLRDVEHILIRGLINARNTLTNRTSNAPVLPAPRNFRVVNRNPPPGFPLQPMAPAGQNIPYELEAA